MKLQRAKKILNENRKFLIELGVKKLALFGSVAKDQAHEQSDIDILIDFDSKRGLFVFLKLKNELEKILKCDVDLVTKNGLHPALRKEILSSAKNVF